VTPNYPKPCHLKKIWVAILIIGTSAAEDFRFGSQISRNKGCDLNHMTCFNYLAPSYI